MRTFFTVFLPIFGIICMFITFAGAVVYFFFLALVTGNLFMLAGVFIVLAAALAGFLTWQIKE